VRHSENGAYWGGADQLQTHLIACHFNAAYEVNAQSRDYAYLFLYLKLANEFH